MKRASRPPRKTARPDELRPEYRFDYSTARGNRFASKLGPQTVAVVLEPDVAQVFGSARSVNELLRSVIAAVPPAAPAHRGGRRKAG